MRRYSWFLLHPPSFCLRILSGKKSLKPPQSGEFRISSMNDSVVKLWENTTTLSPIRSQCAIICSRRTIFPPCSMALMSRSLFSARSANEVHQSSFSESPFLDGILLSATSSGFVSMLLYVLSQVSSCASASSNVRNLAILHLSQIQAGSKCIGGKYMNSEAKSSRLGNWKLIWLRTEFWRGDPWLVLIIYFNAYIILRWLAKKRRVGSGFSFVLINNLNGRMVRYRAQRVILLEKVFVVRFALVFPKLSVELCLHLGLALEGEGTKSKCAEN